MTCWDNCYAVNRDTAMFFLSSAGATRSGMEINENRLQEILNGQRQEFQHFIGIMKEDIESKMQLIGGQYKGLDTKLGSHSGMIASVAEDIHIIKSDIHFIYNVLVQ
jgi:hypothetical protein